MARTRTTTSTSKLAKSYKHPESESPMRPEVGTQAQFKKKLPPKKRLYMPTNNCRSVCAY